MASEFGTVHIWSRQTDISVCGAALNIKHQFTWNFDSWTDKSNKTTNIYFDDVDSQHPRLPNTNIHLFFYFLPFGCCHCVWVFRRQSIECIQNEREKKDVKQQTPYQLERNQMNYFRSFAFNDISWLFVILFDWRENSETKKWLQSISNVEIVQWTGKKNGIFGNDWMR